VDLNKLRSAKRADCLRTLIFKDTQRADFADLICLRPALRTATDRPISCGEDESEAESEGARKRAKKGATCKKGAEKGVKQGAQQGAGTGARKGAMRLDSPLV